ADAATARATDVECAESNVATISVEAEVAACEHIVDCGDITSSGIDCKVADRLRVKIDCIDFIDGQCLTSRSCGGERSHICCQGHRTAGEVNVECSSLNCACSLTDCATSAE